MTDPVIDNLCVNTIRCLCLDAIEKAKSGHPGAPLGAAPMVFTLWDRFLKHDPSNPDWPDRDRFILSAGHASALLYSMLYLTGYDLDLEDIKSFRQMGSRTPGHPEYGRTPGVEVTSGPLGQGFATGIGIAIAERFMAARYNRPGFELFNHYTYVLVSDGDLQEGITSEAASLAGNLQLGKVICLYDSNDVQLDGPTLSFTENVKERFQAYGWNVIGPIDGMDIETLALAIETARRQTRFPNLIICKTVIGYGSPGKAGQSVAHGEPLGEEETRLTKKNLGWVFEEPFTVPPAVLEHMRSAVQRGGEWHRRWQQKLDEYHRYYHSEATQLESELSCTLPLNWDNGLFQISKGIDRPVSTRDVSGLVLNRLAENIPNLLGGSADLAGSTRAWIKNARIHTASEPAGRNLLFGVREHAMGAVINGLALHGGIIPFASTFLVFSDYMRPAIRLAALMKLRLIYIFTHDSIGVGEDGPTHQPVEQLMSLRAIPGMTVLRPADGVETIEAWRTALMRKEGPTALILTRQKVPVIERTQERIEISRGGYVLWQSGEKLKLILIATGSEVSLAISTGKRLFEMGIPSRVVSMPSWSLFESQEQSYRDFVLPPDVVNRISIEAGTSLGWERYVGLQGIALGVNRFGLSAPGEQVYRAMGLTSDRLLEAALKLIGGGEK